MKLSKTTLVVPLAVVLLVGAAGAVMATSGGPVAPAAEAPALDTPTPTPSPAATTKPEVKDDVLTTVLDDLVTKGTITEAQKQAILDGLTTERTARQAARKAARDQATADWKQLKDFLSDGVITQEEFDKLPANSPLRTATGLMDDGKITTDELRSLGRGMFGGMFNGKGHGFGFGRGHGGMGGGNDASPTPSPSAGTSG